MKAANKEIINYDEIKEKAKEYADVREMERESNGFADVFAWNRDFDNEYTRLERLAK